MKILLKNAMVITMNEKREVYRKGDVLIENDRIAKIGHFEYPDDCDEVMDCEGKIVMPSLSIPIRILPSSWPEAWRMTWIFSPGSENASGRMKAI